MVRVITLHLCAIGDFRASPSIPRTLTLIEFLSQLQQQGSLPEEEGHRAGERAGLVEQCYEMYNRARHKDGVSETLIELFAFQSTHS